MADAGPLLDEESLRLHDQHYGTTGPGTTLTAAAASESVITVKADQHLDSKTTTVHSISRPRHSNRSHNISRPDHSMIDYHAVSDHHLLLSKSGRERPSHNLHDDDHDHDEKYVMETSDSESPSKHDVDVHDPRQHMCWLLLTNTLGLTLFVTFIMLYKMAFSSDPKFDPNNFVFVEVALTAVMIVFLFFSVHITKKIYNRAESITLQCHPESDSDYRSHRTDPTPRRCHFTVLFTPSFLEITIGTAAIITLIAMDQQRTPGSPVYVIQLCLSTTEAITVAIMRLMLRSVSLAHLKRKLRHDHGRLRILCFVLGWISLSWYAQMIFTEVSHFMSTEHDEEPLLLFIVSPLVMLFNYDTPVEFTDADSISGDSIEEQLPLPAVDQVQHLRLTFWERAAIATVAGIRVVDFLTTLAFVTQSGAIYNVVAKKYYGVFTSALLPFAFEYTFVVFEFCVHLLLGHLMHPHHHNH
jgi:hypothetical protein